MVLRCEVNRFQAEVRDVGDLVTLVRIASLAVLLPGLLRILDLPALMRLLTPASGRSRPALMDSDRTVRLTNLVLGRAPQTHRTCLIRSLVLYRLLRLGGMPARIHIGVQRKEGGLASHSWLTCCGQPAAQGTGQSGFSEIYAYPSGPEAAAAWTREERAPCV